MITIYAGLFLRFSIKAKTKKGYLEGVPDSYLLT